MSACGRRTLLPALHALGLLLTLLLTAGLASPHAQAFPTDAEIANLLRERIDVNKKGVGIVVGLLNEDGAHIVSHGSTQLDGGRPVDGDSMFEIGSITKLFTTLMLADMSERGELKLDAPIARLLPAGQKTPQRNGREITLHDLATQRSGLPRMPPNMAPQDFANPFADYDSALLYDFLSTCALSREPGAAYEYSNLGMGLLGHILTLQNNEDYETLVRRRVLQPLQLNSTAITLTPAMAARLATGHNVIRFPVPNWDFGVLAGAGALRSSANDMLRFLSFNLGLRPTPLQTAMKMTHRPRFDAGRPGSEIGLGWHILKNHGVDIVWHNGGTAGYRTFIGFNRKKKEAVVVLANTSHDIDDIGRHLLEARYPLNKMTPAREYKAVALEPEKFLPYVGAYRLTPEFTLTLSTAQGRFFGQGSGQNKFEIFPQSETEFIVGVVEAQINLVRNDAGEVIRLVLHRDGLHLQAPKIR